MSQMVELAIIYYVGLSTTCSIWSIWFQTKNQNVRDKNEYEFKILRANWDSAEKLLALEQERVRILQHKCSSLQAELSKLKQDVPT